MTMLHWQQIFATAPQALFRLFLFGTPAMLIALGVAAFLDARIPWTSTAEHPARDQAQGVSRMGNA